jgi:hypothetical protein
MIKINPAELVQTNRSDVLGSLWSTFGVDLESNRGALRVSPRLRVNSSTADLENLGCPVAFKFFDTKIWTVAGSRVFYGGTTPNVTFTQDTSEGTPTNCSSDTADLEIFNTRLWVTSQTKLLSKAANDSGTGAWTERATIESGLNHKLCFFPKFNRLYFVDPFNIKSIDTTDTVATSGDYYLDTTFIPAPLVIDIKASKSFIWIARANSNAVTDGYGAVQSWDGISNTVTTYKLKARGAFALVVSPDDDTPYVMDSNGVLSKFNGSGFAEVGRLPYKNQLPLDPSGLANNRFIHPNGLLITKSNSVLALINNLNNDNSATIEENIPSGVWEWSDSNGFVHSRPISYNTVANTTVTDYGQNRISRAGALAEMNRASTTSSRSGTIMAGATYFTDATNTASAILIDDSLDVVQKYGYLVTSKIFANTISRDGSISIDDTWQKVYPRHKKLLDSADSITIKYRTEEQNPNIYEVEWAGAEALVMADEPAYEVGDEVEIIQGAGSGKCAHITLIMEQPSENNWLVALDDSFEGATGTAKARFQKWKKIGTQTSQRDSFFEGTINTPATWIQLKVCMQFKGEDEINDIILTNVQHKTA